MDKIHAKGLALVDSYGRERIFHGVNVCNKGCYNDATGRRDYDGEWSDEMIAEFLSLP